MQSKTAVEGYQLTPQQTRLWLLQQADGSPAYKSQSAALLEGDLDPDALKAAISEVVNRHEILRTRFLFLPGMTVPLQAIESGQQVDVRDLDLSDCDPERKTAGVEELFREETLRPLDLEEGPAAVFGLARLSASETVLVTSLPSICADGRSLKNLFYEVARCYAARVGGEGLAGEPVQYVDFAEWQREGLEREGDRDGRLNRSRPPAAAEAELRLGLEGEPGGPCGFETECLSVAAESLKKKEMDRVCSARRVSLEVFLLACWQVLVWRLSGRKDVTINTLCEGRRAVGLRKAVGAFAHFSPCHTHLEPDYQFDELVEMVGQSMRSAEEELNHLLSEDGVGVGSGRAAGRAEAIGFEYEEWPDAEQAGAVKFSYWKQYTRLDRFRLKLGVQRKAEGLRLEIQYDPSIFTREAVVLIGGRYLRLLESAVSNDQSLIGELEVVGRVERERLLVEWNRTERGLSGNGRIHELIGEQAARRADAIAVIYGQERLSYGELDGRANQLANHLRSLGVGPDCVVGLYLGRSTEMVVGLLGILKAGGAYLPLEAGQPGGRLGAMLEDAGARVVVTKQEVADGLPEGRRESVSNLLEGLKEAVYEGESEGMKVSVNAPLAFDASVKQVIQLGRGAALWVAPEEERVDAEWMVRTLREEGVEALDCTPSQLRGLAEAGLGKEGGGPRLVLVGGEAIDRESWRGMSESESVRYYNVYGPTECTVDATASLVSESAEPTIGRPLNNTRVYILDEEGRVAPVGVVGEIYLGGAGLARGYLGDAVQTGERFVPDGYGSRGGERLYRTGDLGRYLADGRIVCEGRKDGQVKMRGYRIELGEIEEVMRRHPWVRDAVVIVREDEPGQRRLVGYVAGKKEGMIEGRHRRRLPNGMAIVEQNKNETEYLYDEIFKKKSYFLYAWKAGSVKQKNEPGGTEVDVGESWEEITEEKLRKHISERLPAYMAPAAIVIMEELPLSRNGKVDRGALPRPEAIKKNADVEESKPRNAYEEIISGIWKEVLKVDRVDKGDNFFEIGGDSLLATQIASRVREVFRLQIGIRSIFEKATIEGLGQKIEEAMRAGEKEQAPPLVRVARVERLPLSFAQRRLWFLDQLAPNNPFYNCPGAVRLEGRLDIEALERSVNEIVRRHEVLRTRIVVEEGQPVQVIEDWAPRSLEVEDLTDLPLEEREEVARRTTKQEAVKGFDLGRGPLIRVKLLKLGGDQHVALFTTHHIVSDAWSMGVLVRELCALYQAMSEGKPSPLPELEIQYADYAVWQRAYLAGGALEAEVGYWKEKLKDAATLDLPTDHARPPAPSYRGGKEKVELGKELSEGLRNLSRREGATMFMTLMAAFKTLLMRYSGEEDISVGTAIANRTRREVEGLIGFFVNTLVMRTDLRGNPSFRELIKREREVALGAYAHQEAPFEKLVEEINPGRDLSRSPLFQVMMTLQNTGRAELEMKGLKVTGMGEETGAAKFELTLILSEVEGGISGSLEYSLDLYEGETIRRMARHYEQVLGEVAREAGRRIREIELLSEAERRQIVEEWNETGREYEEKGFAHEMIGEQARRRGEAIAVRSEQGEVSYGELERRANRLGNYLRKMGVGREEVVGICADRTAEMVIAMLGVMKAGAAYVPIDGSYPDERVRYMLEDAGVRVMLTQGEAGGRVEEKWVKGEVINLERRWEEIGEESDESPGMETGEDNLAYVIYTSGSTGKPKGVSISRRGLANSTCARLHFYREPVSSFLLVSPFGFDSSVAGIYWTLCQGVTLVLPPEGLEREPVQLLRLMEENNTSHLLCLPTLYSWLLTESRPGQMNSLKCVIVAGEACPSEVVERRRAALACAELFNEYGPTEGTVWSSVYGDCVKHPRVPTPIGKPIANTQMYILDEEQEPAPVGVRGEIYIAGMGLARGYLGRPELTAERFLPNKVGGEEGGRVYRTGDLGRYLSDGNIEFIGRADEQVKVRGYRIELGEIQAALQEHRSVRQSVVVANNDERGDKRVVGYVVGDGAVTGVELKNDLRQRLPGYMVPEAIILLDEMPLTANGKVDRKKLPAVSDTRPKRESLLAPRDVLELQLAQIWETVLGVQPIDVRDDFFDLGGHSLLAVSLMAKIRSVVGRDLPLSVLFQGGTVERLATILRREANAMPISCLVGLQTSGDRPPMFFAHPAGGNVLCYLNLARCLGADQPFYGLQTPGLYGERDLFERIEDMASHYIDALRTIQPNGPYLLGGCSGRPYLQS